MDETEDLPLIQNPDFWVNRLPYQSASSRGVYRLIKRLIDLLAVLLTLPLWLPLLLVLSSAIYLGSGRPIFFVQERTGYQGKRFRMYKFRTMVPNAEEKLQELAAAGLAKLDESGKLAEPLKLERDPRITPLGRFLRRSSLDELPQVINVLFGNMSIVGPRPTSWDLDAYQLVQTERLRVLPGITGLWQIYDRGSTDFDEWFVWDEKYVEKFGLALDAQILVRTVLQVLRKSGAR